MNENPQPTTPTPEDPREKDPVRDPPVDPEHDIENPDDVVFDADETER